MVPIDDEILELIDRITEIRSHGRPMPHPRYRRPPSSCSPTTADGSRNARSAVNSTRPPR